MRKSHVALLICLLLALVLIPVVLYRPQAPSETDAVATPPTDWETYTDAALSFRYPKSFPTTYLHETNWPPKLTVSSGPFSCELASNEMGNTEEIVINSQTFCVTRLNEGAAGSTYTESTYVTEREGKIVMLRFVTRAVQCANYDEPERIACEKERAAFDIDALIKRVVDTIVFK